MTRESVRSQGRLPGLIANRKLCADIGLPQIDPSQDRADLRRLGELKDMRELLDGAGFMIPAGIGRARGT